MLAMRGTSSRMQYGSEITTCPASTVQSESWIGYGPLRKSISSATATTIGGTTSGTSANAVIALRPRKRRRASG